MKQTKDNACHDKISERYKGQDMCSWRKEVANHPYPFTPEAFVIKIKTAIFMHKYCKYPSSACSISYNIYFTTMSQSFIGGSYEKSIFQPIPCP